MCSTNTTHLPIEKNSPIHNIHLNIIFPINYDILNQNHACQHQKADDMAFILPLWNRDDLFFLQYLHYSTVKFLISTVDFTKTYMYLSFKPTLFGLIAFVCFVAV